MLVKLECVEGLKDNKDLGIYRVRYKRTAMTLTHRMYKIVVVLFKLSPSILKDKNTTLDDESVFDKLYSL